MAHSISSGKDVSPHNQEYFRKAACIGQTSNLWSNANLADDHKKALAQAFQDMEDSLQSTDDFSCMDARLHISLHKVYGIYTKHDPDRDQHGIFLGTYDHSPVECHT